MRQTRNKGEPNRRLREAREACGWSQREVADRVGTTTNNVSRWELGQTRPGPYFRAKLCDLFGKRPQELGWLGEPIDRREERARPNEPEPAKLWSVPTARNLFFTGREELLEALYERLHRDHALALSQGWAINGLGGIGKTQIALEYAYRYAQEYSAVFWMSAATRETLLADVLSLAELLQLPQREGHDPRQVMEAIKRWLISHEGWLLILDNADDLSVVADFLPSNRAGHLLLTTRAQALGTLAHKMEVESMGMAESVLFLLRRSRLLAPNASLDQATEHDLAAAEALAIELGFLPLALDQAGAYIEETGCSLSGYLSLYQTHRMELLQRRGQVPTDHPESVATTWSLNFEHVQQRCPAAAYLLRLCAFLQPDAIPEEVLSEASAAFDPVLRDLALRPLSFNEAIEALRRVSLVHRDPESGLLQMHRLVQAVLRENMDQEEQQHWAQQVIRAINLVFPATVEPASWARCRHLLPQAQMCSVWIATFAQVSEEAASLLLRTASYLRDVGLYEQAEPLFQRVLHLREHLLEHEQVRMADSLMGAAMQYHRQGKYERAESLFQRVVHIREQTLGPGHPAMADALRGLANVYRDQGRYAQAEGLLQRALDRWDRESVPQDPCLVRLLHTLALIYSEQGKYEQAQPLLQRVVHLYEAAFESNPADLANVLTQLAHLFNQQGAYAQAEPLYQRALQMWEQFTEQDHPSLIPPLIGLANLYQSQGSYEEAEPLYQRALRIGEQALGPEHPNLGHPLHNLAELCYEQGKYQEAERLYRQALSIWEQTLGPDHHFVGHPLEGLATLSLAQGNYEEAERLYQRALRVWEQALGQENARVAYALNGLANVAREQGMYEEAERLYQRALDIRGRALGSDHPAFAGTLHDLARLREVQGSREEARRQYACALSLREQRLGKNHPKTNETRKRLQAVLKASDQTERAALLDARQQRRKREVQEPPS